MRARACCFCGEPAVRVIDGDAFCRVCDPEADDDFDADELGIDPEENFE